MKWFETRYLLCTPSQFLLWTQWTSQVLPYISFCLTWFFPVSVFLILFCLTWFFPSGLRFSRIMVLVSGLCLKQNWLTASSKKIDIKNYKMHPWQRWLGGSVDCHAGWLTSLRIGNRFDYFQNLSFFMTAFCNGLIENQPGCEGLLLNDIEMFANLREFKYEKR